MKAIQTLIVSMCLFSGMTAVSAQENKAEKMSAEEFMQKFNKVVSDFKEILNREADSAYHKARLHLTLIEDSRISVTDAVKDGKLTEEQAAPLRAMETTLHKLVRGFEKSVIQECMTTEAEYEAKGDTATLRVLKREDGSFVEVIKAENFFWFRTYKPIKEKLWDTTAIVCIYVENGEYTVAFQTDKPGKAVRISSTVGALKEQIAVALGHVNNIK